MQEELEKGEFVLSIDGVEKKYNTILTFYNGEFKKNYVVYTDDMLDESGSLNLYASSYDPDDKDFNLVPILKDEEWNNINEVLDGIISNG